MLPQKISALHINIVLNALVITGLLVCIILAGSVMQDQRDTALLLANTKELAQELAFKKGNVPEFVTNTVMSFLRDTIEEEHGFDIN